MGAFMAVVTGGEGGGNYSRLKRGGSYCWGRPLGLHAAGEGGGGVHGAVAREEEAVLGRCGEGGRRLGGLLLGRLGQKLKENSFQNKIWIFEYTKALEISRRRFRMNFDMRIFPKFF
jgi:hypothetical protein